MGGLMRTLHELLLLTRCQCAALSAKYNKLRSDAALHDMEKALRVYDDAYARLSWLRYEAEPGIPDFLRKTKA